MKMFTRSLLFKPFTGSIRNYGKVFASTNTTLPKPVTGITIGDKFNVEKLMSEYSQNFVRLPKSEIIYGQALFSKGKFSKFYDLQNRTLQLKDARDNEGQDLPDENVKEMFIIPRYGSLCLFNMQEENIQSVNSLVTEISKYIDGDRCVLETEELDYKFVESEKVGEEALTLIESGSTGETLVLPKGLDNLKLKSTISLAICRSTKLAVLENELERYIMKTKDLIYELYRNGNLKSKKESEIIKYCGELFLIRGKLNLYNELIDNSPDVYWSAPSHLEKLYLKISKQLDVMIRINTLNKKLDYASDEMRALLSVLNEKKGTKLEWIIIWLITVEVVIELYHNYERYFL